MVTKASLRRADAGWRLRGIARLVSKSAPQPLLIVRSAVAIDRRQTRRTAWENLHPGRALQPRYVNDPYHARCRHSVQLCTVEGVLRPDRAMRRVCHL